MQLLLHMREVHGRVIATPVDFPALSVDERDAQAAIRAASGRVTRHLREVSGSMRSMLGAPVSAERDQVIVEPALNDATRPIAITVGLVVIHRDTTAGPILVVRAPEVPQ